MNLFQLGHFRLNSGMMSDFKIECDALSHEDIDCLAYLLCQRLPAFGGVVGVPKGGLALADAMQKYSNPQSHIFLVVDDVFTTGGSIQTLMNEFKAKTNTPGFPYRRVAGGVIFSRMSSTEIPVGITALFSMAEIHSID